MAWRACGRPALQQCCGLARCILKCMRRTSDAILSSPAGCRLERRCTDVAKGPADLEQAAVAQPSAEPRKQDPYHAPRQVPWNHGALQSADHSCRHLCAAMGVQRIVAELNRLSYFLELRIRNSTTADHSRGIVRGQSTVLVSSCETSTVAKLSTHAHDVMCRRTPSLQPRNLPCIIVVRTS